jgi:putative salt-induced outer membrane protein
MKRLLCILSVLLLAFTTPVFAEEENLEATVDVLAEEAGDAEKTEWDLEASLGAFYTSGNSDTAGINFLFAAQRETEDTIATAIATYLYSEDDGTRSANEAILMLRHDWKFGDDDWYAYTGVTLERDEFENLDLRAQFYAGVGTWLEKTETRTIKVETAPAPTYIDYWYWNRPEDEWVLEWLFSLWSDWQLNEHLNYKQLIQVMPNLSHTPNYRSHWVSEFSTPIGDSMKGKLTFIWDYNSAPANNVDRHDIKILLSIVYEF